MLPLGVLVNPFLELFLLGHLKTTVSVTHDFGSDPPFLCRGRRLQTPGVSDLVFGVPSRGVDSPLFSTIVLCRNQLFPWGYDGFLERRIPGKNGEVSPRIWSFASEPQEGVAPGDLGAGPRKVG